MGNYKGFTLIEMISVLVILSIVSLIGIAMKINLDIATKNAYYNSLEGTVSISGRDYFADHLEERPTDTDSASLIEINGRTTIKNLEKKAYVGQVLDTKKNICPGKVVTYLDVNGEYTYLTCLECSEYQSSSRICGCTPTTIIDDATGAEYSSCALDEIPIPTVTTLYTDNGQVYKSYGAEGETYTYNDTTWTSRNLTITITTTYQYAKKIRVVDDTGTIVNSLSCDSLTGTTTKTCTKYLTTTNYGTYRAFVIDDLNRASSNGIKEFYIKLDKTNPNITINAVNNIGVAYTSGTSDRNLDLNLVVDPIIAPSGYTYKWYYSTDLTNGTNRVLISQMTVMPVDENIIEQIDPNSGSEDSATDTGEITNVDTANGVVGYTFDKTDQSLFVNAPRLVTIARKYIIEITNGTGTVTTASKNVTIYRPAAKVVITGKKVKSGKAIQSGVWSNEAVMLTANINDPTKYSIIRWTQKNISTGVKTNLSITSTTYTVSSISTALGDEYTAVTALSDNTDQEESEVFRVKIDDTDPKCGSISGSSTSWTNNSRSISVKCSDDLSGCTDSKYSKTFSSSTKSSSISIKDKAGNTKSCSVNVYVDKGAPSVSIGVYVGSNSCSGKLNASDSYSGVSYKKVTNAALINYCGYAVDRAGNRSSTKCANLLSSGSCS